MHKSVSLKSTAAYLSKYAGINIQKDVYQQEYVDALIAPPEEVQAVFLDAEAGTGKTSIAISVAYYLLQANTIEQIIYVRSSVAVREMGFLPGDIYDKEEPYMQAGLDALSRLDKSNPKLCETLIANEQLKVTTPAFLRGVDWEGKKFIIIDEAQNFNLNELQALLTRPHDTTKIVLIGSTIQCDETSNKVNLFNAKNEALSSDMITPFELYSYHFSNTPEVNVKSLTLKYNYRGKFSLLADKIDDTIANIRNKSKSSHTIMLADYYDYKLDEEKRLAKMGDKVYK